MAKFYITTAISYVNDIPHIGHASEWIATDVLARYKRLSGYDVFFLTGTDENAPKVKQAAVEAGKDPVEFVEATVGAFRVAADKLGISYDYFIRTTSKAHVEVTQALFAKLLADGVIYRGRYEGWYCIHEETFYLESELTDDNCPECGRELRWVAEDSYFFALSKYAAEVLKYVEGHAGFIQPDFRRNEVISYIKGGLKDTCVSRVAKGWGIPVLGDPGQVIYVWFDALVNYLTGAGYLKDEKRFGYLWSPDVQVIGKDILPRFHATLWPAMLIAAGLALPGCIFTHGHWTVEGKKMSKSLGNQVEPCGLADELSVKFGIRSDIAVDVLRYYLLREAPFELDPDFSYNTLIGRFNSDLANDLGNLLNRTLPMLDKYFGGVVPRPGAQNQLGEKLIELAQRTVKEVGGLLDNLEFANALAGIWDLVNGVNKYIEDSAPWRLFEEGRVDELATAIYNIVECLRIISILTSPFMPNVAKEICIQLGIGEEFEKFRWEDAKSWGKLPAGIKVKRGAPIFPRIR